MDRELLALGAAVTVRVPPNAQRTRNAFDHTNSPHIGQHVDRLTTGRRHIRTGSVHVSELIGTRSRPIKNLGPVRLDVDLSLDAINTGNQTQDGAASVTVAGTSRGMLERLLESPAQPPSSHRRQPSTGAQLAKIAGLGVASLVLCGAIAVASTVAHDRRAGAVRPAMDISGEQALLPDRLNSVVPKGGMTGMPTLPGAQRQATGAIDNPGPAPAPNPAAPRAPAAGAGASAGSAPAEPIDPMTKTELVRRFYELAPDAPEQAFSLLDATLLGTDLGEFVQSWSLVRDVQVLDAREQSGDVLATVRLRLRDGNYLRVEQLLDVSDTPPRRIVNAEVLSAQHD
jgi:hypothetical protein